MSYSTQVNIWDRDDQMDEKESFKSSSTFTYILFISTIKKMNENSEHAIRNRKLHMLSAYNQAADSFFCTDG